jgi:hypothetical protein
MVRFSEMLVPTNKPTWRYKPEDQHRQITGAKNGDLQSIKLKMQAITIS